MTEQKPRIEAAEKNGEGFFTVYWSALQKADKYIVTNTVPAVSGIYELYYQDEKKALNLLTVCGAWLGGLRSEIRESIEPNDKKPQNLQIILEHAPLYFRYTQSPVKQTIQDVLWFLNELYFGDKTIIRDSGRYSRIYVKEYAPDKMHWI